MARGRNLIDGEEMGGVNSGGKKGREIQMVA
jgi:hypothetical protein